MEGIIGNANPGAGAAPVTGVTSFNTRTGDVVLIAGDVTGALGFTPYNAANPAGYITGITSGMITTALGYTPYNGSANPAGFITAASLPAGSPPTAKVGLTAVPGISTNFMRADAAPAIDLSINPTWTAIHNFQVQVSAAQYASTVTMAQASGNNHNMALAPTINQSGAAAYNIIFVSPFEQALGTGTHFLLNIGTNSAPAGAGAHTQKFTVDNNGVATAKALRSFIVTFANLPSTPIFGMMIPISDSTVNTWGTVIAGGGAFPVLGFYNGSAWTVAGK